MAVTNNQRPVAFVPAFNEQTFESTSTLVGGAGFLYRVIVTDLITSASQTFPIKQAPVSPNEMKWYANVFVNTVIKHYIPNNVYGFQVCTDAIRKIRVNVGEYTTGGGYVAGTNYDYIVWNGVVMPLDWVDYNYFDYVYTNSNPHKFLWSGVAESGYVMPRGVTYSDKSLYLYTLADTTNTLETLRVKTYDVNGTLLGTSDIANPYYNSGTYTDKYFCIDVGHKGLSQISSGLVTGTYPIITASVDYYIINDVNTSVGSPAAGTDLPIRRIDIECEPTFTVFTLQYLAKSGNFETLHFNKLSELKENVTKTTYRQNPNTLSSNVWSYTKSSQWERVLSSTGQESLVLNTDWLTENQMIAHREIVTSPRVYIDYGSTIGLVPVMVKTNSIVVNKNFNNKLFGITLEVEPTYKNNYQNG